MAGASLNVTKSKDKKLSYFSFGDDEAPVTLPYIPSWLKQTQVMYSKLPMLYAPSGTITLFTTGLCEKVSLSNLCHDCCLSLTVLLCMEDCGDVGIQYQE